MSLGELRSDAVISDAVISDAVISDAVISDAIISDAVISAHPSVPRPRRRIQSHIARRQRGSYNTHNAAATRLECERCWFACRSVALLIAQADRQPQLHGAE